MLCRAKEHLPSLVLLLGRNTEAFSHSLNRCHWGQWLPIQSVKQLLEQRHRHEGVKARSLFVQLVRPSDANPTVTGDVRLTDCETGDAADLTITPKILARYRAAYAKFNEKLADIARRRHAQLLKIDVEADLIAQLSRLFDDGGFRL